MWCKACHHRAPADLQAIIDAGRGDVPLKDLRFRCTKCGSRLTDSVVMAKGAAPEFWWVYAMLLSTMIPSLVNLMLGGASLVRGVHG